MKDKVLNMKDVMIERLQDEMVYYVQDVINANVNMNDSEASHIIEKSDTKISSKKTYFFFKLKHCKKVLINRKKLRDINCETKYNFNRNNKIFNNFRN